MGLKLRNMYWLLGRHSQLSIENKILLYKAIIKPIWYYGIQLWGTACRSNIDIIKRFQSKVLRSMVNAPWFVPNEVILRDLGISTVEEEIQKCSVRYRDRLGAHPNSLVECLLDSDEEEPRLKRFKPMDLPNRFV